MTVQNNAFDLSRSAKAVVSRPIGRALHYGSIPVPGHPGRINPTRRPSDQRLIALLGASYCLRHDVLPWRRCGSVTVVLAETEATFLRHVKALSDRLGPVCWALSDRSQMRDALVDTAGPELVHLAETRCPSAFSCRDWKIVTLRCWALALLSGAGTAILIAPSLFFGLALSWLCLTLFASSALKLGAIWATLSDRPAPLTGSDPAMISLPVVSLLVPLYRERESAAHLIERLRRMDYPQDRLDICLILEAEVHRTRAAIGKAIEAAIGENIGAAGALDNIQVITVPAGKIRTKPRALNFALDFAKGTIIGIYDAEDVPAPDQIRKVVERFSRSGPDVGCLQGVLDYYNHGCNWMARCFALEYAVWFRLVLPGIQRLGFVIPLGGTTLFLRRSAIEAVGGWDAHNVTEDADLGVRLARSGYRTLLIDSVTEEEANARVWPWVRQRSRWLKGYAITWGVHMRHPAVLWRDLGPWRFLGFQILFIGTLSQFILAPLPWLLWLIPLGMPRLLPIDLGTYGTLALAAALLAAEAISLACAILGARKAGRGWSALWSPTLQLYFPLATVAVYKALWEILKKPHYWDKTAHGQYLPAEHLSAKHLPSTHLPAGPA